MVKVTFIISVIFAVFVNLIPVYGVLKWGWIPRDLLLLYWVECIIIGLIWLIRIFTCKIGIYPFSFLESIFSFLARIWIAFWSLSFYAAWCAMFGMFLLGALFFGNMNYGEGVFVSLYQSGMASGVYLAALGIACSHLFTLFVGWFLQGYYKHMDHTEGLSRIYIRGVILFTICAVVVSGLEKMADFSTLAVIAMVALKIIFEIYFLIADYRKDFIAVQAPKPRHPSKNSKVRRA